MILTTSEPSKILLLILTRSVIVFISRQLEFALQQFILRFCIGRMLLWSTLLVLFIC